MRQNAKPNNKSKAILELKFQKSIFHYLLLSKNKHKHNATPTKQVHFVAKLKREVYHKMVKKIFFHYFAYLKPANKMKQNDFFHSLILFC